MPACIGQISLSERVEQSYLHLRGYTYSRILHITVVYGLALAFLLACETHDHLALVGESDGVCNQILQNLTNTARITIHLRRHVGVHVTDQFDILEVRRTCQRSTDILYTVPYGKAPVFQLQNAGFDLGKIQQVVDDRQQRIR